MVLFSPLQFVCLVPGEVDFSVGYINATSALVIWQEPDPRNGYILDYTVVWENLSDTESIILDPGVYSHRITSLKPYQQYNISVIARTIMGQGDYYTVDITTEMGGMLSLVYISLFTK